MAGVRLRDGWAGQAWGETEPQLSQENGVVVSCDEAATAVAMLTVGGQPLNCCPPSPFVPFAAAEADALLAPAPAGFGWVPAAGDEQLNALLLAASAPLEDEGQMLELAGMSGGHSGPLSRLLSGSICSRTPVHSFSQLQPAALLAVSMQLHGEEEEEEGDGTELVAGMAGAAAELEVGRGAEGLAAACGRAACVHSVDLGGQEEQDDGEWAGLIQAQMMLLPVAGVGGAGAPPGSVPACMLLHTLLETLADEHSESAPGAAVEAKEDGAGAGCAAMGHGSMVGVHMVGGAGAAIAPGHLFQPASCDVRGGATAVWQSRSRTCGQLWQLSAALDTLAPAPGRASSSAQARTSSSGQLRAQRGSSGQLLGILPLDRASVTRPARMHRTVTQPGDTLDKPDR